MVNQVLDHMRVNRVERKKSVESRGKLVREVDVKDRQRRHTLTISKSKWSLGMILTRCQRKASHEVF
jgi:hypothetical protein